MAERSVLDEGAAGTEGAEFEQHRRYLSAVAYRLLGSLADAEDAVQDTWLRWQSVDRSTVQEPRAYLTTIVTRICYDLLGSARARREAYFGEWLPEPSIGDAVEGGRNQSPEEAATLGESVSYAMLAVMEQLSPAERVAFVLHDVFAVEFEEIAEVLGRSPEATRQLASRGRRRVRERERGRERERERARERQRGQSQAQERGRERAGERQRVGRGVAGGDTWDDKAPDDDAWDDGALGRSLLDRGKDRAEHRKAVAAFAAACMHGDLPGLMAVLDPDVLWHSDGGGIVSAGTKPVVSAEYVARLLAGLTSRWIGPEIGLEMRLAEVNGDAGVLVLDGAGAVMGVIAFDFAEGRIVEAYAVVNPEKLSRVAGGVVSPHLPRRRPRG